MQLELLLLTVLYAVALAAFVGAINAHGPVRVTLSYFLAILCLCAAVFHTSQYLAVGSSALSLSRAEPPAPPPNVSPAPAAPEQGQVLAPPALSDTQALAASRRDAALAEARAELKQVQESAARVLRNLGSLNLGNVADMSDEEYEALQNRAVGYLSEARRTKERFAAVSAKAPRGLGEAQETLDKAIENLVAAAYNAERFFKSENDTEERERMAGFRRGSQAASAALNKAEGMLAVGNAE
ncbi:MAG TPA: hypothetical protein VK465_14115 [Fibrobacteria bacterium]|nr:hypothetical protein [Fibrobacteria bacterium]